MADETAAPEPRAERRGRRWTIGLGVFAVGVALAAFAGLTRLQSHPVSGGAWVAGWVADRVAERVEALLPEGELSFASLSFGLDLDYHPEILLEGVSLRDASGASLVDLRSLQSDLSIGALLRGEVVLRRVELSGAVVDMRRAADGTIDIALEQAGAAPSAAPNSGQGGAGGLAAIFEAVDAVFARPGLSELHEITAEGLTVNYVDAVSGESWTGDGGFIRLTREGGRLLMTADAALLTGRQDLAVLSASIDRDLETGVTSVAAVVEDAAAADIASQAPALNFLSVFDAPVSMALRARFSDAELSEVSATVELGEGALKPNASSRAIPFTQGFISLDFDPALSRLTFEEFLIDTDYGVASATGTAQLQDFEGLVPQELVGQFHIGTLEGNAGGLYPAEERLDGVDIDFRLRLDPFTLDIGQAVAVDGASQGAMTGRFVATSAGWDVSVDAAVNEVRLDRAMALWPAIVRPGMRGWIDRHILDGQISGARWSLRAPPDAPPMMSVTKHFTEGRFAPINGFPEITGASGTLSLVEDRFVILLESGVMEAPGGGLIDASGSVFRIADTRARPGTGEVLLRAAGETNAILSAVDAPPFRFFEKAGRDVPLAEGETRVEGRIAFPIRGGLRGEDFAVDIVAEARDVRSGMLVEGRELALPRADISVSNEGINVAGSGTLDGVAFDGSWRVLLGPENAGQGARVSARVALSPEALEAFDIDLPPVRLSGRGQGRLDLVLREGVPPSFSLTSDLSGLGVGIPALSWSKPASATANLEINGQLGAAPVVDALALDAPGLSAEGAISLAEAGGLAEARFDRFAVGNWLSGAVSFVGRGPGLPPQIRLRDAVLDIRRARFGEGAGGGPEIPLDIDLERLVITDTIALTDLRGTFTNGGSLAGAFEARVNGGAPVEGVLSPSTHGAAVTLRSSDGGGVVRDAGIFEQIGEGDLTLSLVPQEGRGVYNGDLSLAKVRVSDAPSVMELLSAVSIVGLLEQADGGGLSFSDVTARFQIRPGEVIIAESSAVGASLGISLDGRFNIPEQQMDFQGVISPFYLVNSIGSIFTRRGEGLLGFNFTLRGTAQAPNVAVNPLSGLTPGMFREIFRRAPPDIGQ